MVATSRKSRSYTVTVCRYIMFCANTRPLPVAVTDFGEMSPPILLTSTNRRSDGLRSGAGAEDGLRGGDDGRIEADAAAGDGIARSGAGAVEQPVRTRPTIRAPTKGRTGGMRAPVRKRDPARQG